MTRESTKGGGGRGSEGRQRRGRYALRHADTVGERWYVTVETVPERVYRDVWEEIDRLYTAAAAASETPDFLATEKKRRNNTATNTALTTDADPDADPTKSKRQGEGADVTSAVIVCPNFRRYSSSDFRAFACFRVMLKSKTFLLYFIMI